MINYIILLSSTLIALYTKNTKMLKFTIILLIYIIITNTYEGFTATLVPLKATDSIIELKKCPEFNENNECNLTSSELPDLKCTKSKLNQVESTGVESTSVDSTGVDSTEVDSTGADTPLDTEV